MPPRVFFDLGSCYHTGNRTYRYSYDAQQGDWEIHETLVFYGNGIQIEDIGEYYKRLKYAKVSFEEEQEKAVLLVKERKPKIGLPKVPALGLPKAPVLEIPVGRKKTKDTELSKIEDEE